MLVVMGEVFELYEVLPGVWQGVMEVEYDVCLPHSLLPLVKAQVWGLWVEEFAVFAKISVHHPEVESKKLSLINLSIISMFIYLFLSLFLSL